MNGVNVLEKLNVPLGKPLYLQGNLAIAYGALAAGCNFYAGYPITPSSEIMHFMAERIPKLGGVFIQAEDELAAINMLIGASLTGAKPMTATSGPGFSLMQEAIGLAVAYEAPIVIVNVMRTGPSTGIPTRLYQGDIIQAMRGSHGDYETIVLAPHSVQTAFEITFKAFEYAEKFRNPVIVLADETIGHLSERVELEPLEPKESRKNPVPETSPMILLGEGKNVFYTGLAHREDGLPTISIDAFERYINRLVNKIRNHASEIFEYETLYLEDADVILLSYGSASRSAEYAVKKLRKEGKRVGFIRLFTLNPIDGDKLEKLVDGRKTFVVESNAGQLVRIINYYIDADPMSFPIPELPKPKEIIKRLKDYIRRFF